MSRRLLKYGGEALKPHFVDGRWERPLISKRVAARLRKEAVMNGRVGPWQPSFQDSNGEKREGTKQVLGWDPAWDTVKAPKILRPAKLHARERNREERFQKIETAMAGMAAKIAQHKESMRALKPKPGIETLYKKVVAKAQKRR
ncbi:hypothetical protein NSK_007440 [Nannochloropsis salina CCMP1776]|uniref:Large ribosomal subunit protein mL59 domain-containing protein n=1 Tax=Nannochloropsis salina CCMP1776 TaxID=1027361 RepID=A0A4D9CUQ8_9STRA|nr:hypothetical protein NSK_007440 [Nannochloropsis salina CCMP1776]|eukprot:TFJ81223.1 hypothetical protein NSK_007440 [Nannochloropsis salina CCMP1776]